MAERSPELWLIRHGETEWSLSGQHTGKTDLPLNETGRHQATALSGQLAGRSFALVLSSPLTHAFETCKIAGYGDAAKHSEDLMEWDYGDYEGLTTAEIRKDVPGWTIWDGGVPRGETAEQVAQRARRVIDLASGAGGDVALFAHGHLLRILAACWLALPPNAGRLLRLSTASISVLGYERETRAILGWNRDWHLCFPEAAHRTGHFSRP